MTAIFWRNPTGGEIVLTFMFYLLVLALFIWLVSIIVRTYWRVNEIQQLLQRQELQKRSSRTTQLKEMKETREATEVKKHKGKIDIAIMDASLFKIFRDRKDKISYYAPDVMKLISIAYIEDGIIPIFEFDEEDEHVYCCDFEVNGNGNHETGLLRIKKPTLKSNSEKIKKIYKEHIDYMEKWYR